MKIKVSERSEDTKAAIALMYEDMQYQEEPLVGIFWYSVTNNELFGVTSSVAMDLPWRTLAQFHSDIRTDKRLHQDVWRRNHFKNIPGFEHNYMYTPRGRVFEFRDKGFKVYTGKWLYKYPQAKELILQEFQLPKDNTEFIYDEHWDIGHGWSQEF